MKIKNFFRRFFAVFLAALMMFSTVHVTFAGDGADNNYKGPAEHDKSKTATPLYDDRYTDVTLSVPGKVETLSTDIVFVIDKSSSDKLSSDFANGFFEQLVEVQKRSGALVKVGVVIFNYDGHIALPLTQLTEENYQTLLDSLPSFSGGTNADAGLVLAKQMLDEDSDVDASRKHVILIGDGKNWAFDVNGAPHTILLKDSAASTTTMWGAGTTTWLEARKATGYSIPGEFGSWDEYWEQVKSWVEADGDRYVFDITNYNNADASLKPDYQSEEAVASAVIIGESADHALNMDRALYDTWESYTALQDAGYNCNAYYSGSSSSDIGYHLMKMLAGVNSMNFEDIKYDILYSVSKGSVIEDYIGYSADETEGYNFDFVDQADKLVLKVGNSTYNTAKLDTANDGATSSYEFTAPGATEATFTLDYFKGNGTTTERFVWTFGENVSRFAPVSLTYTLDLVERSTVPGIHDNVDTNISATLYPKDSDGNDGTPEDFEKPKVKYEVLPISVSGVKTWDDENDRDGRRPEFIVINLLADGEIIDSKTVTAADGWAWTFEGLREYKGSSKIVYSVTEESVDGYETVVDDFNVTNTHNPEKVEFSGVKTWNDENDRDGMRPESITINLLANGVVIDTKTVAEADGWAWTFADLYKYENGAEIVYSVTEESVDGYETVVDGFNVTNTHNPEKVEFSGVKTWDDENDRDGIRPESITINLLADGVVIDTKTVTAADGWAWTFADLYKYENGAEIVYSITEESVDGYETVVDGFNVINTHETEKLAVSGVKTWDDENDRDGIRPESITINLLADGEIIDTKTVTEADGWAWTFEDLYKYENGTEIVYTISEEAVDGYETVVDGFNVTNTHNPEKVEFSGSKTWNDENDRDGIRPESITINLLANGEIIDTKTVTAADGWAWTFADLYKYENGAEIVYSVTEEAVEGYETVVDGFNVTNTHNPEKVEFSGVKTWDDENDRDGIRPESITINLLANGKVVDTKTVTAADGWAWTFADLYKYENGTEIVYTISEDAVDGYETVVDGFNVTNIHVPEEPETSEPETSEPETSEPETSEPETSEPETSEPETSEPETSEPETSEPETTEPEEIVDDPEVPLAPSVPEDTEEPEEEFVEIEDPEVPLAPEAPQTGSNALFAWLVVAATSGTLFTFDVFRRRRAAADR